MILENLTAQSKLWRRCHIASASIFGGISLLAVLNIYDMYTTMGMALPAFTSQAGLIIISIILGGVAFFCFRKSTSSEKELERIYKKIIASAPAKEKTEPAKQDSAA